MARLPESRNNLIPILPTEKALISPLLISDNPTGAVLFLGKNFPGGINYTTIGASVAFLNNPFGPKNKPVSPFEQDARNIANLSKDKREAEARKIISKKRGTEEQKKKWFRKLERRVQEIDKARRDNAQPQQSTIKSGLQDELTKATSQPARETQPNLQEEQIQSLIAQIDNLNLPNLTKEKRDILINYLRLKANLSTNTADKIENLRKLNEKGWGGYYDFLMEQLSQASSQTRIQREQGQPTNTMRGFSLAEKEYLIAHIPPGEMQYLDEYLQLSERDPKGIIMEEQQYLNDFIEKGWPAYLHGILSEQSALQRPDESQE